MAEALTSLMSTQECPPPPNITNEWWKMFGPALKYYLKWFFRYSYFQNLTLKIQGQVMGKVKQGNAHPVDSYPFCSHPFLKYNCFRIGPWKSKTSVSWLRSQFTVAYIIVLDSHQFNSTWISPAVPEIWLFEKSKFKVMGEDKVQGHVVGSTTYQLTSLCSMSIGHPIPRIGLLISKFDLESPKWRS